MERKQEYWGSLAAWYLFLAAMGATGFVVIATADLLGGGVITELANGWISLAAVVSTGVGSLFLMVELTQKMKFYLIFARSKSIMTVGSLLLSSFLGLAFIYATFFFDVAPWAGLVLLRKGIAVLGIIAALGLVAYPGLELGEAKGRGFWNGGGLIALFLISGAATGTAAVMLLIFAMGLGGGTYILYLKSLLVGFLVLQFLFIPGYVWGMKLAGAEEARRSVALIVSGLFREAFWGGVMFIGTIAPLATLFIFQGKFMIAIAGLLVLVGGFFFRIVFLQAAVRVTLPGEERLEPSDQEIAELGANLQKRWQEKALWLSPKN